MPVHSFAHSMNYRNIFDPSTGFMRGRNSGGQWITPFDAIAWGGPFTEGDMIYLYDYVGQPWKAQNWIYEVEDRLYKPGPAFWLGIE